MWPARRQLDRGPLSVAVAALEALGGIASKPRRVGKPLRFELDGCWSARRGPYRVIYRIDDATRTVSVLAVGHRAAVLATFRADATIAEASKLREVANVVRDHRAIFPPGELHQQLAGGPDEIRTACDFTSAVHLVSWFGR